MDSLNLVQPNSKRDCVKHDDIEQFKATYGLRDEDLILVPYGSQVYGTGNDKSDLDYIAIVPENRKVDTGTEFRRNKTDIQIYNRLDFQDQLKRHKIHTLEAYYLPDQLVSKAFKFKLDLTQLRHELSQKASHSWVKAKKKIEVEKDYYIGRKSLFHSLRILMFGTQIAKQGKIADYGKANQIWLDIMAAQQYNWDYFKEKYQPEYNRLATTFKKLAPK